MEEQDIMGVEITVGSSKGGGNFDIPDLDEDLVYPAVLVSVKEDSFTYNNELKETWKWTFELTGEEHEYEVELEDNSTETRRRKVTGSTSRIFTPKSKSYEWYSKILGEKPDEGSDIKLSDMLDVHCNLIIKNKKGKVKKNKEGQEYTPIYANVDRIMTVKQEKEAKPKAKPKDKKEDATTKEKPAKKNAKAAAKKTEKPKVKAEKIEESTEDSEAFSDIF